MSLGIYYRPRTKNWFHLGLRWELGFHAYSAPTLLQSEEGTRNTLSFEVPAVFSGPFTFPPFKSAPYFSSHTLTARRGSWCCWKRNSYDLLLEFGERMPVYIRKHSGGARSDAAGRHRQSYISRWLNAQISFELLHLREQRGKRQLTLSCKNYTVRRHSTNLELPPSHLKCTEWACLKVCLYPLATAWQNQKVLFETVCNQEGRPAGDVLWYAGQEKESCN